MNVHKHNVHVIYLQPLQLHTVRKLVLRASAGGHEQKKQKHIPGPGDHEMIFFNLVIVSIERSMKDQTLLHAR